MKRFIGTALLLGASALSNQVQAESFPILHHFAEKIGLRKDDDQATTTTIQTVSPATMQTAAPPLAAPQQIQISQSKNSSYAQIPAPRLAPMPEAKVSGSSVLEEGTVASPSTYAAPTSGIALIGEAVSEPTSMPPTEQVNNLPAPANAPRGEESSELGSVQAPEMGMCKLNSKHLQLNYEVKDAGPSGVMGVEVYMTRDGKAWQKVDTGIQRDKPYYVDVPSEGVYGFILLAKTGFGGGKEPPVAGDPAQLWVEVDMTKPVVFLTGMEPGAGGRTLTIHWTATDKNLGPRPISLSYSDQADGPWLPIAVNIANSGTYLWQIPPSTPSSFKVRLQATDLAGNVGSADTPNPVRIDLAQPTIDNIRVSATDRKE